MGDPNFDWFKEMAAEWPTSDYANNTDQRTHGALIPRDENVWKYFTRRPGYRVPHVINENEPPKVPPKPPGGASFKHTMYVPEWTDPFYVDPKHMPDSAFKLRQALRPAQLATDALRNPTPFAKRFGFYPWGTDGRSLLTPTKDVNVTLPMPVNSEGVREQTPGDRGDDPMAVDTGGTKTVSGSTVVEEFMAVARARGLTMDELLDSLEIMDRTMTDNERCAVQAMLNIRAAEDWQSILWGDVTTEEMMADNIFQISSTVEGTLLGGEINELFGRDKWIGRSTLGALKDTPRCMYNVNGRRGEWNPQTDDWLWDRMRPLLLYVSRLWEHLSTKDAYWQALMNPFNRIPVSRRRDARNKKSRFMYPALTFTDRADEHKAGRHWYAEKFHEKMDGAYVTLQILQECVRFYVTSSNHAEGMTDGEDVDGLTSLDVEGNVPGAHVPYFIKILISVENMYPLLHDGYDTSEKMMSIHQMATTILHELAHAVNFAHFVWLRSPGPRYVMQGYHRRGLDKLAAYGRWLFGPLGHGAFTEPHFDDEHKTEAGFSMENAVFGGVLRSMAEWGGLRWDHVAPMPSGFRAQPWPDGGATGTADDKYDGDDSDTSQQAAVVLRAPRKAVNSYTMFVPWPGLARRQTEEFWAVQADKYGSAALRMAPEADTKGHNMFTVHQIDEIVAYGREDAATAGEFREVMRMPMPQDSDMIRRFLQMQVAEALQADGMRPRWSAEVKAMTRRMRKLGAIHCLLQLYYDVSTWHAECSHLGPPADWASRGGAHPASARCEEAYPAFRAHMKKFGAIVGRHSSSHDAGSRPRWLPPKLAEEITSAAALRDRLEPLFHEGVFHMLPLAKQTFHMANEVVVVAEGFLGELWTLSGEQRARFLKGRFKSDVQCMFRNALQKCGEAARTAHATAELDLDEDGFRARTLATMQKVAALVPLFDNLAEVPDNALDMLTCVPHLKKSRRLTSRRWLRAARRELLCLHATDQQRASKVLEWLQARAHTTAADVPKPDLAGKSEQQGLDEWNDLMRAWETNTALGRDGEARPPLEPPLFPHAPWFVGTGQLGEPRGRPGGAGVGPVAAPASGWRQVDVFGYRTKREHQGEGPGEGRAAKKQKTEAPSAGQPPAGGRKQWFTPLAGGSGAGTGAGRRIKLLSPQQLGKGRLRLSHSSSLTDGTSSSFSDRSTDSPFRGLSPAPEQAWHQAEGARVQVRGGTAGQGFPAAHPLFGVGTHADGPATRGMFPHPYALNATTTSDLGLLPAAAGARPPPDFRRAVFLHHRSPGRAREREREETKQRSAMLDAQELEPGPYYGLRRDMTPLVVRPQQGTGDDADDEGGGEDDGDGDGDDDGENESAGRRPSVGMDGPGGAGSSPPGSGEGKGKRKKKKRPLRPWEAWEESESVLTEGSFNWDTTSGEDSAAEQ